MKSILNFVAVCAVCAFVGCTQSKTSTVAPGAVGEKTNGCCASKAECAAKTTAQQNGTSMGAVGEKSEGCQKVCPMSGKTSSETVSPGAVGEKKSGGCCAGKSKSGC